MKDENELISMAESLPLDMKTRLVDALLSSMHPTQPEIDALWADEAEKRASEVRSGKVKTVPGDRVFKEIRDRYSK
jgi:putative addiction module component (TIGR02574 family)